MPDDKIYYMHKREGTTLISTRLKVGDQFFYIDRMRTILDIVPYTGMYKNEYSHVLRLTSHVNPSNYTEVNVLLEEVNGNIKEDTSMGRKGKEKHKSCKFVNCPFWVASHGKADEVVHCNADEWDIERLAPLVCMRKEETKKKQLSDIQDAKQDMYIVREPKIGYEAYLWEATLENAHVQLLVNSSFTSHALAAFSSIGFKKLKSSDLRLKAKLNCEHVY